ncbi:hypothetical protein BST95_05260 [Halioglobus japonicus]|uniref:Phospholipase D family protein n=2 Tax=Halioglobus japonicus TaxID=930805 RepID=A0AAP8MDU0_9GAMM|nr:hypothetical protein BST95_05260 [Halioglobus japonicus]PLW85684.1 phospholipase D family protein [Halioglobus japonicus]GHD16938.1 phospholipase D family protein [Halioglobus japonicus]
MKNMRLALVTHTILLAVVAILLTACASVPYDYPRSTTTYVPGSDATVLGTAGERWKATHGDKGGFVGMASGVDALGARLRLFELAEETVDAQYFILKKDRAGVLFVNELLLAADRGVRVRLLVDDIFSPGVDHAFSVIAAHPNVEVRLFNPLPRQTFKYLGYLTQFERANRRMHNKSFTVDGAFSIVGGRNIGEEYFEIDQDTRFDDYEVLMIGDIVEQVQQGFDVFWNSELAVPIEAFGIDVSQNELDEWRSGALREVHEEAKALYEGALDSRLLQRLNSGELNPVVAEAALYTDTPDKLLTKVGDRDQAVLALELGRRFREASDELFIVTPYYIPQDYGMKLVEDLLARGVTVKLVTNSLASTNHVPVHGAYKYYRRKLLEMGVEIYEIKVDAVDGPNEWGYQPGKLTLHSKATAIDRDSIFIGSLNFDPRSILINTEMGIFIESSEAGSGFTLQLEDELSRISWRVELDDDDKLRWTYDHEGVQEVVYKEPQAGWWRRFQAGFYGLLPIEDQL